MHTSTACQPQKAPGVVENLLVAGLRDAHATSSGACVCTLDLPALFTAGDAHPYRVSQEAPNRKQVIKEVCREVFMMRSPSCSSCSLAR